MGKSKFKQGDIVRCHLTCEVGKIKQILGFGVNVAGEISTTYLVGAFGNNKDFIASENTLECATSYFDSEQDILIEEYEKATKQSSGHSRGHWKKRVNK